MNDIYREIEIMKGGRAYHSTYEYPTGRIEECIQIDYPNDGREYHFPGGGMMGFYPLSDDLRAGLTINADSLPPYRLSWWKRFLRGFGFREQG